LSWRPEAARVELIEENGGGPGGQSGEQIIPCVIPRRGEGGMVLKASLDRTKEAALPAALAGVQAVAAGMHWLVAHSVGMSRRLCAACTWLTRALRPNNLPPSPTFSLIAAAAPPN